MAMGTGPADGTIHYERPVQARATVRGVALLQLATNGLGALSAGIYFRILYPRLDLGEGSETFEVNLLVLTGYLLVTVVVAVPLNAVLLKRGMRWVREGRAPTTLERWDTLSQPLRLTVSAFVGWVGAAVTFGVLNHDLERITFGIGLVGLVCSTLLYLLLERHFRPIFALALAGADLPRWRREILTRIMAAWWLACAVPLLVIGAAPLGRVQDQSFLTDARLTFITIGLTLAGAVVMRAAVGGVSEQVNEVRAAMAQVEDGDLDVHVPVTSLGELGQLQAGFNDMVEGLRQRRRLQELFGRQVGTDVARQALEVDPELGGEEREITALFVDLTGFTTFSEAHTPHEVVAALNEFFAVVIRVVMEEGGWVNKFEGDAALCIFGAPMSQPDHAQRALRAAARLPREVAALPSAPDVGIGVATGRAVAGNVGTAERYEYTVIGDTVNVASRLSDLAKGRASHVLATERTLEAAAAVDGEVVVAWREGGTELVKGRSEPIAVFVPA